MLSGLISPIRRLVQEIFRMVDDELIERLLDATRTATDVPLRRPARPMRYVTRWCRQLASTDTSRLPISIPNSSAFVKPRHESCRGAGRARSRLSLGRYRHGTDNDGGLDGSSIDAGQWRFHRGPPTLEGNEPDFVISRLLAK
jgi:hypothetical protein